MKTYWADVAFIVAPLRERASDIIFKAKTRKEAVEAAVRFARNRERAFPEWRFSAIKVGEFTPRPIAADGALFPANGFFFFEWKYDWPGTLEERIEEIA